MMLDPAAPLTVEERGGSKEGCTSGWRGRCFGDDDLSSQEGKLVASRRYHARRAFEPAVVAEVGELLVRYWDPDGALAAAAQALESRDLAQCRSTADYALAVCGMLAAGGTEADVSGFLRREETKLLGEPRSTGHTRMPLARACWRAVRGLDPSVLPGDVPVLPGLPRGDDRDPVP